MRQAVAAIPNETFFPVPATDWPPRRREVASIPDAAFYGDERPPGEPGLAVRWASRPLAFGASLFLLGWLGILIQRSFLQQLVVGAPVFEEFAKFGLALVVVQALRAKHVVARLPYAWLSGLGFGVLEHFVSYGGEEWLTLVIRAGFHAATTGLSMAAYSIVEPLPEVRARWLSTLLSTVLHWSNNFGVVLALVVGVFIPLSDQVVLGWSVGLIVAAVGLTLAMVGGEATFRARAESEIRRLLPPLGPTGGAPPAREKEGEKEREGAGTGAPEPSPRDSAAAPPEAPPPPETPREPPSGP